MGDSLSYLDNLLILNNSRMHFLDPFQMGTAKGSVKMRPSYENNLLRLKVKITGKLRL